MGLLDGTQGAGVDLKKIEGQVAETDNPDVPYFQKATEQLAKKRDEVAATIGNPLDRMKFISNANAKIANAESKLKLQSQAYWHNEERTKAIQTSEEDIKLTLVDPSRVGETTERIRTRYDAAFKLGHFDSYEEYQKTTDSTLNSMQIGVWKNSKDITQQRNMLNDFKSGKIQNKISADSLIQMEDELSDRELKYKASATADSLINQYGSTKYGGAMDSTAYDKAINDANRNIKNPEERDLVISKLGALRNADSVADNEIQSKLYEDLADQIDAGDITYADITREQQRTLSAAAYASLKEKSIGRVTSRVPSYSDADVTNNFYKMANQGYTDQNLVNMQTYLRKNGHLLTPGDYKTMSEISRGQKDLWQSGLTEAQAVAGLFDKDNAVPKAVKDKLVSDAGRWKSDFTAQFGRPPTDPERQKFLDVKTIEIVKEKGRWWDDKVKGYQLEGDEKIAYDDVINYLIKTGRPTDPATVQAKFDQIRLSRGLIKKPE